MSLSNLNSARVALTLATASLATVAESAQNTDFSRTPLARVSTANSVGADSASNFRLVAAKERKAAPIPEDPRALNEPKAPRADKQQPLPRLKDLISHGQFDKVLDTIDARLAPLSDPQEIAKMKAGLRKSITQVFAGEEKLLAGLAALNPAPDAAKVKALHEIMFPKETTELAQSMSALLKKAADPKAKVADIASALSGMFTKEQLATHPEIKAISEDPSKDQSPAAHAALKYILLQAKSHPDLVKSALTEIKFGALVPKEDLKNLFENAVKQLPADLAPEEKRKILAVINPLLSKDERIPPAK